MRRSWWVAGLFLVPSLVLTLLVNAAFSLERGLGAPGVWAGVLVVPWVAAAGGLRRASVRGLWSVAALCLLFAAVVHLRLWTGAGGPVLEREGLVALSRWALGAGAVAALVAGLVARRLPAPGRPTS
jgi:hypothetical protein